MKVLLINNLHRKRGGADVVYFNTAELLEKAGHEVHFFSITTSNMDDCDDGNFFAPSQDSVSAFTKMCNYCYNKGAAENLQKLIDKIHPDIAHVHLIWGGLSPSILEVLNKNHVPVVHTVHDYRMVCPAYTFRSVDGKVCESCKGGKYYKCLFKRCSKGSIVESALMTFEMYLRNKKHNPCALIDGFIYVSQFARDKHEEHNSHFTNCPSIVLYNFWAGKEYNAKEQVSTYDSYYLYYGRLSREKGIRTLIKAFENYPSLRLWIIGDGPLRQELEQYCQNKGLQNILFKGYMAGDTLYGAVHNAKFVCVPSEWYENNPMTIVESYALGTPVIGARIGGIPEIIEVDKTGLIFSSGDEDSLKSVLEKSLGLSQEEYENMGANAKAFAQIHFSKEQHLKSLEIFYKTIIDNYKR